MKDSKQLGELFIKWTEGRTTAAENELLFNLMADADLNADLLPLMRRTWDEKATGSAMTPEQKALLAERVFKTEESSISAPVHRIHFLKTAWFKYAAAIIIIAGIGAYLWNIQQKEKPLITTTKPVPVKNDILPGFDRAVLTLSNGQQVQLDRAASETINDGTLSIKNINGQLTYQSGGIPAPALPGERSEAGTAGEGSAPGGRPALNTMSTPRGGQYKLILSDGTNVWLNAASSITYPTSFTGKTREVTITGEAYFEVRKDPSKPFIVKTPKEDITVLGTSFNVNAYFDEAVMKTSLLEGSVKIADKTLRPGQAFSNGKVFNTNIEQDIAWKKGFFSFSHSDVPYLMRQISRWYNINVKYAPGFHNQLITGKMERNLKLSEVMDILEAMGVKYHEENNSIIIE